MRRPRAASLRPRRRRRLPRRRTRRAGYREPPRPEAVLRAWRAVSRPRTGSRPRRQARSPTRRCDPCSPSALPAGRGVGLGVCGGRVDGTRAFGEASARMPGPQRDDLGRDRDRRLLGRARPDIQADGAADARELLVRYALLLEAGRPVVVRPAAPHRPDVTRRCIESLLEYGHIELRVVGQDGDDAAAVDLGGLQVLVGPGDDYLVRRGEALAGGEDGAGVADDHPVAHELANPRDRRGEVYGAEDVHPGRWGERLDEDGDVLHPALAARSEVDRLSTPTLEQAARRLHDGLVQPGVARRAGVIFRGDQHLAPEGALRSLYYRRNGHGRLLGEGRVPAGE